MMHKTKLIVCLILSFISITCLISSSKASQQRLINFQGRLTDQQGNLLDGTYDIIFSLYASATDMDPIWTEAHTNVSVSKGLVNVLLGSITSFDAPNKVTFDESRYLGITIDCDNNPHTEEPEMLPRQQIIPAIYANNADRLDGKDSLELAPPGIIVMWSGSIDIIPHGWALCDGTNGTPDLRDRFIMGAYSETNLGSTGGASSYKLSLGQLPSHTHSGSTSSNGNHSHSGSTNTTGSHSHGLPRGGYVPAGAGSANWGFKAIFERAELVTSTNSAGSHNHSLSTNSSGSHSHSFTTNAVGSGDAIDNRPAYYALAFIMKL